MSRPSRDGRSGNRHRTGDAPVGGGGVTPSPGNRRRSSRQRHVTPLVTAALAKAASVTAEQAARSAETGAADRGAVAGANGFRFGEQKKSNDAHRAVDAGRLAAVDTRAVGLQLRSPGSRPAFAAASSPMEKENFGKCLRRARESREISLSEVAQKTKVSRAILELLEKGDLDLLPACVYSRGFIRSFARAVGADENEPLSLYERAVEARNVAEKARVSTPVLDPRELMAQAASADDEATTPRRGLGLAVFVIILLLIATITLSLLLRRPPPSGEGLSVLPPAAESVEESLAARVARPAAAPICTS